MIRLGPNLKFSEEEIRQESLAVIGARNTGKTHTCLKIQPQLKSQVIILDPEGQYPQQQRVQPATIPQARWLAEWSLKKHKNVRLDHSRHTELRALEQTAAFLQYYYKRHVEPKRRTIVIVEEAYYYAPERGVPTPKGILRGTAEYWVYTVQSRGRNRGIGAIVITQRPAQVSKHVLGQCGKYLIFRLNLPNDKRWLKDFGLEKEIVNEISRLPQGECYAVGFEAHAEPQKVKISK